MAPYGQATVEALKSSGLWNRVQTKGVYPDNISQAKQFGAWGNADAVFTAYSLVLRESGTVIKVDPKLCRPIDQALGAIAASGRLAEAKQFALFVLGPEGRSILSQNGYELPSTGLSALPSMPPRFASCTLNGGYTPLAMGAYKPSTALGIPAPQSRRRCIVCH